MPPSFQQKILRVVEYGTFTRIGGTHEIRSSARIVAASNADLAGVHPAGHVPARPLRPPGVRGGARAAAARAARATSRCWRGTSCARSSPRCRRSARRPGTRRRSPRSSATRSPGNVRELKTIVERAAYRDTTREINVEDLALPDAASPASVRPRARSTSAWRRSSGSWSARRWRRAGGNQADAARRLGLAYHRFRYYAGKHR